MTSLPPEPSRRQVIVQAFQASLGLAFLPHGTQGDRTPLPGRSPWPFPLATSLPNPAPGNPITGNPITVVLHLTAQAATADALVAYLLEVLPTARAAEGCRHAGLHRPADDPRQVILFKIWDSHEAEARYLAWETSTGRLDKLLALVEPAPQVEYWQLVA